jgi:hypothetical protein
MRLEVVIEGEVTTVLALDLFGAAVIRLLLSAGHDTGLLVVGDTLLKEVGLATQGDVLHEVEGVGGVVHLVVAESEQKTISDELNVLLHKSGVHAEKCTGQSIREELFLVHDSLGDDVLNDLLAGAVLEVGMEEASKVGVKTLITRDKFVREGQTRHKAALLEPEDRGEGTAEEDTLDSSEGDKTLTE